MALATETDLIAITLDNIRQRLLDLSKHNPLLNYQAHAARTIHIAVTMELDALYQQLVVDNEAARLSPAVTEIDADGAESFIITTQHEAAHLASHCTKLARQARTALEETGSNILYLTLGMLTWYPEANQTQQLQAPLLLVPVKCLHQRLSGYPIYEYWLSYHDEEIEVNPSLVEKLSRDYQLTLPEFNDAMRPSEYLTQVTEQLADCLPTWQVANSALLDLFSFTRLLMYRDLDPQRWSTRSLLDNPRIQQLLLNQADGIEREMPNSSDNPLLDLERLPLVLAADSSQQAVLQAVLQGKTQVAVEGPPGTGKSQTITNLIASLLANGKSILFVAEKKAALEVVKSRLEAVGLSDFCLDLHSHKVRKGDIYQAIQQRLETPYPKATEQHIAETQLAAQKKNYTIMPNC